MTSKRHYDCPYYDRQLFDWDLPSKTMSVEASMLSSASVAWWGRIYPDACDIGIVVVGKYREVLFNVETEHRDGDDITHWTLRPCSRHVRLHPEDSQLKVVVYNT